MAGRGQPAPALHSGAHLAGLVLELIYQLLFYLALPLLCLHCLLRARGDKRYLTALPDRLGFIRRQPGLEGCLWIHAVSVGEVHAATPLIQALRQRYPHRHLLVTTTTPAGADAVRRIIDADHGLDRALASRGVSHSYLPWDLPGASKRFLARAQPAAGLILETELWPTLFGVCRRRKVPLLLVNARRSARSTRHYQWIRPLISRTLNQTERILTRGEADARRFRALGACCQRLCVTGNIKFDYRVPATLADEGRALRLGMGQRPVWMAACTHAGEEEQILTAHHRLREHYPQLLLVMAPRHPRRCERLAALCQSQGLLALRTSQCAGLGRNPGRHACRHGIRADTAVLLGDGLGELPRLYALSDIAFIGGSLVRAGGHNPLEAAAQGLALLIGPHTHKMDETLALFLRSDAMTRVSDDHDLARAITHLLRNPAVRQARGRNARSLILAGRGATGRVLAELHTVLRKRATLSLDCTSMA